MNWCQGARALGERTKNVRLRKRSDKEFGPCWGTRGIGEAGRTGKVSEDRKEDTSGLLQGERSTGGITCSKLLKRWFRREYGRAEGVGEKKRTLNTKGKESPHEPRVSKLTA